ncbi:DUF424 family protein [Candidatus Pacearchaeota archaeon]|nr:DUF424 family protein [Candidatus Pacearchaeota archaeon]
MPSHLIKVHKTYRLVVAVCDAELLGKKFEEGNKQLNIMLNFYNGEEIQEEELMKTLIDLAKEDATFNIAGKSSVNCALKCGIISKAGIKKVQGVPFALVLL